MCNEQNKENVKLTRSEAREQAFMLLFSKSFDDEPFEETIEDNAELYKGGICGYAQAVVTAVEGKQSEIDDIIAKYLRKDWSISRISKTSLAILRLAIYEIKYVESVPQGVSINEAVELSKKYSIDESKFVNGVLGAFVRDIEAGEKE
ncbi:MAG: transcription antitermination factor NusB [Ruminococcus sp.]|nr:transcription antitermination factor NusB [Ruminococcus sp.]